MDGHTLSTFSIDIGLPQGSQVSVILYILYNNTLLIKHFDLDRDAVLIGYVNDVVHLVAAKLTSETASGLCQQGLRLLQWGSHFGAIFDHKKAQFHVHVSGTEGTYHNQSTATFRKLKMEPQQAG